MPFRSLAGALARPTPPITRVSDVNARPYEESTSWKRETGWALALVGLTVVLITIRYLGSWLLPVYDDAYITFRYARNLAASNGFVFQPGEPLLGTTSPAFALITAAIHAGGVPIEPSVIVLNTICDALTLLMTFRVLSSFGESVAGVLFGLFFAVSPIATRICVGGMEMNVFLLISVLAIFLYHSGRRSGGLALAAASVFLRPEGIALVGVLLVVDLYRCRTVNTIGLAMVALLVIIPSLLAIDVYFGHILPQSVVAKSRQLHSSPPQIIREFLFADPLATIVLPVALWGAALSLKKDGFVRTAGVWGMVYLLAYLVMGPHAWSWYGEPVHYVVFLLGAVGAASLMGRLGPRFGWLTGKRLVVVGGVAGIGIWMGLLVFYGPSGVTRFVYAPLEEWCRAHVPADATILASDIGAIGYFSGARIYDANGLVWPAALSYRSLGEMIVARRPDYLFLGVNLTGIARPGTEIGTLYEPVRRFSRENETDLRVDAKDLPSEWVQDYVLFRRVSAG